MAIQGQIPIEFYLQSGGGGQQLLVASATGALQGAQKLSFQQAQQYLQQNPNALLDITGSQNYLSSLGLNSQNVGFQQGKLKNIFNQFIQQGLSGQPVLSGMVQQGGILTDVQSQQAQQQQQQQIASGQLVQIGTSPTGQPLYAPSGSGAAALQQGIQSGQVSATGGAQQQGQFLQGQGFQPTMPTQLPTTLTEQRRLAQQYGIQNFTGTPQQIQQLQQAISQGQQQPQAGTGQYQNLLSQTGLLKTGARGTEVQQLQQFLQSQGLNVGNIDGIFGPKTAAALRQFQQQQGIRVDAIVGPETRGAIQKVLQGGQPETGISTEQVPTLPELQLTQSQQDYSQFLQTQSFDSIFNQLSAQLGLDDLQSQITLATQKLTDFESQKAEDIANIQNNPWISQSLLDRKLQNAEAKWESKRQAVVQELQFAQKQYDSARQEAQFAAKMAIEQMNRDRAFAYQAYQDSLEAAYRASNIPTQVVRIGSRQVLINKQTGQIISDIGPAATSSVSSGGTISGYSSEEVSDIDSQINEMLGSMNPEQLDWLIDNGYLQ